ncbi:response regulator [Ktedonospora formicarum]|uniref:Response regulator n=1 Tax=Ktedonospora formicarum TaxID=2778364 RepID=A0A8J3HTY3_9CHLR|nr:response regulator [Ktedonospora formicarum]GHO43221.1 response regulator [Ktedonospora formicarum]
MVSTTQAPILFVEDSEEDTEVFRWVLHKLALNIPLVRLEDGEEALDYLYQRNIYSAPSAAPRPALILLDLNLIETDGREVLQTIKSDDDLKAIPVIIWSGSDEAQDVKISFQEGATSYISKPLDIHKLKYVVEMIHHYWFGVVVLPENTEGKA